MNNRPMIDRFDINDAIEYQTRKEYETGFARLKLGPHFTEAAAQNMAHHAYASEQKYDEAVSSEPEFARVTSELTGYQKTLAEGALVRCDMFVIPKNPDIETVEAMLYNRPVELLHYGALTLVEPKRLRMNVQKATRYFLRGVSIKPMTPVVDGLEAYSNGTLLSLTDAYDLKNERTDTERMVRYIRSQESQHIDRFLDDVLSGQE